MENIVVLAIKKLGFLERIITSIIFCFMMVVVTAQIIMRYIFNHPLLWSEEFARYAYVWLVFLGAAYGVTQEKHVAVTLLTDRLPHLAQKVLKILCNLLVVAALVYMLPHAVNYIGKQNTLLSGCMRIPMSWVFASLPVGYILVIVHMLLQSVLIIKKGKGEERS